MTIYLCPHCSKNLQKVSGVIFCTNCHVFLEEKDCKKVEIGV